MSEVGVVLRIILGLLVSLILAYLTTSNALPDGSVIKRAHYYWAFWLTGLAAFLGIIEFMRTMRVLDTERLGRFPKYALIALALTSAGCLFAGVGNLIYLHSQGHEQRLEESKRREQERQLKKKEEDEQFVAECVQQRTKDIDLLIRRRGTAFADHKKCIVEWVRPHIFSTETAEQHCAPKQAAYDRLSHALRERQTRECPLTKQ